MDGEVLGVILQVSLLVFVVSSMLAMGFSLTMPEIIEPLKSVRLVVIALAVNFIDGVDVNAWDIASSLIFLMILPLAIGLFVRWRYEEIADGLQPLMAQTSTIAIALLLVSGVIVNFDEIIDLIGTGGFAAIVLFLLGAFLVGYFGGGSDAGTRSVLGLGTAQRNLSAALVVGGQNFPDNPGVVTFIIVTGIVGLILLLPGAGELGKRAEASGASAA